VTSVVSFNLRAADVARAPELTNHLSSVGLVITDANPVTLLAAHGGDWSGSWGVWLEHSAHYPAPMIARDVKTLSHLMDLDHIVLYGEKTEAAAEIVRAMLSDDVVTMTNAAATLVGATNHPAPPRPVAVWATSGPFGITDGETYLSMTLRGPEWTYYERDGF